MSDLLWEHLRDLPAFRALLRAVEARFYADLPLPRPMLDLGCGDGHFGSMAFGAVEVGLDPWREPLSEARERGTYGMLSGASGAAMPYPDGYFATVVSNSVLEHIPDLPPVLSEAARVLRPGGWLYFCVPGPSFEHFLSISQGLDGVGLHGVAKAYRRFFTRISRHHHCDGVAAWRERLAAAGFVLDQWWPYFSRRALAALEWGHYLGLPSLVTKKMTGHWVLWSSKANLWPAERLIRPLYEERLSQPPAARQGPEGGDDTDGAYLFFVAHKACIGEALQ